MKLPIASERKLISRIQKGLPSRDDGFLRLGIGDDAAVLRVRPGRELVLTCDLSLEGRHFLRAAHSADAIGWKSLARATSDLAAMGAKPRCFLLSLALPRGLTGKWLDDFLGGMARAAFSFDLVAAGGDTTEHETILVNITVVGEVEAGRALTRAGAQPGNLICVSGRLGEAQLGLEVIRQKLHKKARRKALLQKHLYPEPRLALGQWLAGKRLATAMIDTSDGLSTDLAHLCDASGVGARLFTEKIPTVVVPIKLAFSGIHALELALHGGEDYELLFTVPANIAKRLPRNHRAVPLTIIGEITRQKPIVLTDSGGASRPLMPRGWDPLRMK
ncbi:MAG TPA: thiamine-phosphate kinase [Candidatus Dormibacteraeota bacterium]|nr:thiamine-phosphate kinase [Candidatus Dormibacteraeota bacterium]